jgi:hypothetical protein
MQCAAQSLKVKNHQNEVLMYVMRDSLDLSPGSIGIVDMKHVNVSSKKLNKILGNLNVNGISKAFPEWGRSDSLSRSSNTSLVEKPDFDRVFKLTFLTEKEATDALTQLNSISCVLYAEKNSKVVLHDSFTDGTQWYLKNDGRNGGTSGADIKIEGAWAITNGSSSTKIAFLDTGVDINHDEFSGRASGDTPVHYHGTGVAGVAAANGNNTIGIRGINWNTTILSKAVFGTDTTFIGDAPAAQKIIDAVDAGADILNCSWGGPNSTSTLALSFAYAYKMNRLTVASMGNDASETTIYPAGYYNVFSVGASTNNDARSWFSNSGSHIDVVSPGGSGFDVTIPDTDPTDIYTTSPNNGYRFIAGTSFSAPAVSGLASLMKGYNTNLSNDDIAQIIRLSADKVAGMGGQNFTYEYGYGRINAERTMSYLRAPYTIKQTSSSNGSNYSTSQLYGMQLMGVQGLAPGNYYVYKHEVRKNIIFPDTYCTLIDAWGRGVNTNGLSQASPNFGMGFCEVVPGTLSTSGFTLRTYVYEVYNISMQYLGYYPTSPSNVNFAYTTLGIVQPTITGSYLVCPTNTTYYLNSVPSGSTITWDKSSNLTIVSSTSTSCTVSPNGTGDGWIKATLTQGCSVTMNVWIGAFSSGSISVSGTAAVCPNSLYTYTAQVPGGHSSSYSYSWTYPSGWTLYNQNQNTIQLYTPSSPGGGTVRVSVTNCGGSSGYSGITVYPRSGCGRYFMIYPNPASDNITITLDANFSSNTNSLNNEKNVDNNYSQETEPVNFIIRIYNNQGTLLSSNVRSGNSFNIPLINMRDGTYIIEISDGKTNYRQPLIIKHN